MAFTKKDYMPGDILTAEQMNAIQTELIDHKGKIDELAAVNLPYVAVDDLNALRQYIADYVLDKLAKKSYAFMSITLGTTEAALVIIHKGALLHGEDDIVVTVEGSVTHATVNGWRQGSPEGVFTWQWSEWEYINPPMMDGVEYRTVERHNGCPVYVKTKSIEMGDSGETRSTPITSDATEDFQLLSIDAVIKPPSNNYAWTAFPAFNQSDGSLAATCEVTVEDTGNGQYQTWVEVHSLVTMLYNVATITVKYTK